MQIKWGGSCLKRAVWCLVIKKSGDAQGRLTAAHHQASGMLLNGVPGWSTSTECMRAEKVKMPMAMNRNRQHT